jgi:hypothetical protein
MEHCSLSRSIRHLVLEDVTILWPEVRTRDQTSARHLRVLSRCAGRSPSIPLVIH